MNLKNIIISVNNYGEHRNLDTFFSVNNTKQLIDEIELLSFYSLFYTDFLVDLYPEKNIDFTDEKTFKTWERVEKFHATKKDIIEYIHKALNVEHSNIHILTKDEFNKYSKS